MNKNIQKLYQIASKSELKIIGINSGTSIDGLDIALCSFTGSGLNTQWKLLEFETVPFPEDVKDEIRKVFAKREIDFQHLSVLHPWLGSMYGDIVLKSLKNWNISPDSVDVIASHGQTVFHAPKGFHKMEKFPNGTFQIGDGDHLAVKTGIITISDFRQKHAASGGDGAPLAVNGEFPIFSKKGQSRILLNIGGIANFSYLPGSLNSEQVFETDTGPGNTLLDAFTQEYFGQSFDDGGKIASTGKVDHKLLQALKSDDFFKAPFPKTTGPELFKTTYVRNCQEICGQRDIAPKDLLATLTRFTAETIAMAIDACVEGQNEKGIVTILYSGGGGHNTVLMRHLRDLLPKATLQSSADVLGINVDAKEAVLFAVMANEALKGGRSNFGKFVPSVSMGKISFPN